MPKVPAKSQVPAHLVAAAAMPSPDGQPSAVRVSTNTSRRALKRNENLPGCWAQGGTLYCFKSVERALADIAKIRGVPVEELSGLVDRVQAARVAQEPRIYMYPVAKEYPDGVEVTRSRKTKDLTINLFNFLAAENLLIPVGRRQRFDLTYVPKSEAPAAIGESLLLDFSKRLEEKVLPKRKRKAKKKTDPSGT
jgi:hypothetical protein